MGLEDYFGKTSMWDWPKVPFDLSPDDYKAIYNDAPGRILAISQGENSYVAVVHFGKEQRVLLTYSRNQEGILESEESSVISRSVARRLSKDIRRMNEVTLTGIGYDYHRTFPPQTHSSRFYESLLGIGISELSPADLRESGVEFEPRNIDAQGIPQVVHSKSYLGLLAETFGKRANFICSYKRRLLPGRAKFQGYPIYIPPES